MAIIYKMESVSRLCSGVSVRSVHGHVPSCLCAFKVITTLVCDSRMARMVIKGSGKCSCRRRFCSKVVWPQS